MSVTDPLSVRAPQALYRLCMVVAIFCGCPCAASRATPPKPHKYHAELSALEQTMRTRYFRHAHADEAAFDTLARRSGHSVGSIMAKLSAARVISPRDMPLHEVLSQSFNNMQHKTWKAALEHDAKLPGYVFVRHPGGEWEEQSGPVRACRALRRFVEEGLSDKALSRLAGEYTAYLDYEIAKSHNWRLPGLVDTNAANNTLPYVDIASGFTPFSSMRSIRASGTQRPVIFTDLSDHIVAFLAKALELSAIGPQTAVVKQVDVLDTDQLPTQMGTVRMGPNLRNFVTFDGDWVRSLASRIPIGGKIVQDFKVPNHRSPLEDYTRATVVGVHEFNRSLGRAHEYPSLLEIDTLLNQTLVADGKGWVRRFGHYLAGGTGLKDDDNPELVEGQTGFYTEALSAVPAIVYERTDADR